MFDLIIDGYYGHRNFGDDLIMAVTAREVASATGLRSAAVVVDRQGLAYASRFLPECVSIVPAESHRGRIYRKARRVILGGGGLFFDYRPDLTTAYRLRKRVYYLRNYTFPRAWGTRFAALGIGLGPFVDPKARGLALQPLRHFDVAHVRDAQSLEHMRAVPGVPASQSGDVSFADYERVRQHRRPERADNKVVIVLRHFRFSSGNHYLVALKEAARSLERDGWTVTWCSFQPDYDAPALEMLDPDQRAAVFEWDPAVMDVERIYEFLAEAAVVVSARLHALFVCAMLEVPAVGIAVDPKLLHAAETFPGIDHVSPRAPAGEILAAVERVGLVPSEEGRAVAAEVQGTMTEAIHRLRAWL